MKKIYLLLLIGFLSNVVYSQNKSYIMPEDYSFFKGRYTARDYIRFEPGFSYAARPASDEAEARSAIFEIDESLVLPADYVNSVSGAIDDLMDTESDEVGSIAGQAAVSPVGAATYNIPIITPPGVGNMTPQVSLNYNSMGGNGVLGKGGSIGGISAITRVSQNHYFDGYMYGVNLNSKDRFALDGNRLILRGSSYGGADYIGEGAEYETAQKIHAKITLHGSGTSQYFVVETKDGRELEYGNSDDSKVILDGKDAVFTWYLKKATDKFGNTIEYSYKQDGGEILLEEISYAGGNKISFYYDERSDKQTLYVAGGSITRKHILRQIKVFADNSLVRKYKLLYSDFTFSHLKKIKEYSASGEWLNSTAFEWGNKKTAYSRRVTLYNPAGSEFMFGDFNGDGYKDLLVYEKSYVGYTDEDYCNIHFGTRSKRFNSSPSAEISLGEGFSHFLVGDFNDDGIDDIMKRVNTPEKLQTEISTRTIYVDYFRFYYYKDGDFVRDETKDKRHITNASFSDRVYSVDLDGDGRLGLFFTDANNNFRLETGYGEVDYSPDFIKLLDFNGNGKTDIIAVKGNIATLYEWDYLGVKLVNTMEDVITSWHKDRIFPGDFNGDGKTDLLVYNTDNKWYIYTSTGKEFKTKEVSGIGGFLHDTYLDNKKYEYLVGDVNGDGISDIIEKDHVNISSNTLREIELNVMVNNGDMTFSKQNHKVEGIATGTGVNYFSEAYLIDMNGDGLNELVWKQQKLTNPFDILTFDIDEPRYISAITNGLGLKTEFTYSNKILNSPFYGFNRPYANNITNYARSMDMVSGFTQTIDENKVSDVSYNYYSAYVNRRGLGFLGFSEVVADDNISGIEVVNRYQYDNKYVSGVFTQLYESEKKLNGSTIETVTQEYNGKRNGNRNNSLFSYIDTKTTVNSLTGTTVVEDFDYDDYGNLTKHKTDFGADGSITIENSNFVEAGSWCISAPKTVTVKKKYKDEPEYSETTTLTYYNGALKSKRSKGVIHTITGFDRFGNATKTETFADGKTIKNEMIYDSKGRFVEKTINTLGHAEEYKYNAMGQKTWHKDMHGLITTYKYNSFGKIINVNTPIGNSTYTYGWDDGSNNGALYYKAVTTDGAPDSKLYYDALGREVRAVTETLNGEMAIDRNYNDKGLLEKETFPYPYGGDASTAGETSYLYDDYGRITKTTSKGIPTSYSYSGKTKTTTLPSGEVLESTTDDMGFVTSAKDNGGEISYLYYSHGGAKEITAPTNVKYAMTYDKYGFQETLTDPNAGKITFDYNELGELKSQTDARGNKIESDYDVLGRLTEDGEYSYEYVESGNGLGLLEEIRKGGTVVEKYKYDETAMVTSIESKVDDISLTTGFEYDNYKRVSKTIYPGGLAIKYVYNHIGDLIGVNDNEGKTIWALNALSNDGQIEQYTYGNGLVTTLGYDGNKLLESISVPGVQNLSYEFDANEGELDSRTGLISGAKEDFLYDANSQLTSVSSINSPLYVTQTIRYSANMPGNIEFKSKVGTYVYDDGSGKMPHAIKHIELPLDPDLATRQNITYTTFNKVDTIKQNGYIITFTYGASRQRTSMKVEKDGNLVRKVYYSGAYERHINSEGNVTELYYIAGPNGLAAIYVVSGSSKELYYVHTDHLGSLHTVTNSAGAVVAKYYFDAWGIRKELDVVGTNFVGNENLPWLYRGFTGHEHIPEVALINMNGRIYDPVLGRFLSPDPYVQAPNNTGNFNRYAYCMNNPLMFTDPNGEAIHVALVIAIAFVVGAGIDYGIQVYNNNDYSGAERFYKGIDWFDVTMGGIGGNMVVFASPAALFWYGIGSPFVTNAIDVEYMEKGSNGWQVDIVGVKSKNGDDAYVEKDKTWGYYFANSGLQALANGLTHIASNPSSTFSKSRVHSQYTQSIKNQSNSRGASSLGITFGVGTGNALGNKGIENGFVDNSTHDFIRKWELEEYIRDINNTEKPNSYYFNFSNEGGGQKSGNTNVGNGMQGKSGLIKSLMLYH